jgi:serine/threonine protein kinase
MDKVRAAQFAKELNGRVCMGWRLGKLVNAGKSAVVLEATKRNAKAAVKFFDPELVEKHGGEIQARRIERERSLIGKSHPNVIQIVDGGFWNTKALFFVVMEFLPWKNLADALKEIPIGRERQIISQVAAGARFLDRLGICHRDIKPENIVIDPDFKTCKLLDLGVIKPHSDRAIPYGPRGGTFLGTLRYSPPEFLLGEVDDSAIGWRAVTFYQLGAVLHDLIMRRPLFAEYENPFGRLVVAVKETKPEIESAAVSPAIVELARDCLVKAASTRLRLVNWKRFEREPSTTDVVAAFQSRINRRVAKAESGADASPAPAAGESADRLAEYAENIRSICKLECIEQSMIFPPIEIHVLPNEISPRRILVSFDPSAAHALMLYWRLEIQITWLDPTEEVVEIVAGASVSNVSIPTDHHWSNMKTTYFGSS